MKILHTADVHLRQPEGPRWQALAVVLDTAADKQVDAVTIGGDLFDQDFNASQARGQIRSLFEAYDFPIIVISGNHDSQSYQQGFDFGANVNAISSLEHPFRLDQTSIYGLPFAPLSQQQLLTKLHQLQEQLDPDQVNILLFHGELLDQFFSSQDFGQEGERRYLPVRLSYFSELDLDYVLAGHFHTRFAKHQLPNQRLEQGGFFVYPGSPISITHKETGARQAVLLETGQPPQAIKLNTPHFHQLELNVNPSQTTSPVVQLQSQLKKLSKNAWPIAKLSGYFDQEKIGLTEKQLAAELEKLQQTNPHLTLENQLQDIGQILDSGLYQAFVEKLSKHQTKYQQPDQLKQTLISAMIKHHG